MDGVETQAYENIKEAMMDLSVIIVSYNVSSFLDQALITLADAIQELDTEVYIVDNASRDDSVCMVKKKYPWVNIIENSENLGFARANNKVLARVKGRYILLLNPDTVLRKDTLKTMVTFLDEHPEAGAAGPKLVLEDGSLDLACRRSFPTPQVAMYRMLGLSKLFPDHPRFGSYNLTYLDPDLVAQVDSVVGAFMLVRGEAIQQVGLLDEDFFMYGEDLDWAYRITQAGWTVYYNPAVTVLHVKRAASRHSRRAAREFYRAMRIFYYKHYANSTPFWLHWLVLSGISLRAGLARAQQLVMENGIQQGALVIRNVE